MNKAFIYARVSTDEQAKEGQSIETQIRLGRKYASENDLEIINTFVDEGKSATNMNRPALQEMLGQIKETNFILVQDTDRLARNTLDHLKIKALFKKNNVTLISISQPLIDDSPEGNLIDTLLAASNAFQSQITGRKTSKVMEQKAEAGWYPGGLPPLGYRNVDNQNPSSSLDKRIIEQDSSTAPYIKNAFEMYSTGQYSTKDIAKYLNDLGIKSPYKSVIHTSTVCNMFRNPFYVGRFYWKKKLYNGKHETLISEQLFSEVQNVLDTHNQGVSRKRIHNMLLRGLLYYKESGSRMWGEIRNKNGKIYSHYFCKDTKKGTYTDSFELEKQVEKIFEKRIQITEEYKKELLELAEDVIKEVRSSSDSEKTRLQKQLASYESAVREAEDDRYVRKVITSEVLMRTLDRYKPLVKDVKKQLEKLDIDYDKKRDELEELLTMAENIGITYKVANKAHKRGYLTMFFSKLWVKDKKIVDFELTPDVKELIENGRVRVSKEGLPR